MLTKFLCVCFVQVQVQNILLLELNVTNTDFLTSGQVSVLLRINLV